MLLLCLVMDLNPLIALFNFFNKPPAVNQHTFLIIISLQIVRASCAHSVGWICVQSFVLSYLQPLNEEDHLVVK